MNSSLKNLLSIHGNHKVRKMLAHSYLREGRCAEALSVYLDVLKESPDDPEVLLVLGNLYLAASSSMTAYCLYNRVLELDPENLIALRQHAAAGRQSSGSCEEILPTTNDSLARLAARLEAVVDLTVLEEIRCAADMMEKGFVDNRQETVSTALDQNMQQLMPALIEMNIREAREAGLLDLAESLRSMQINIAHQAESQWKDKGEW